MSRRQLLLGGLIGLGALAAGVALAGLLLGPAAWRLGGATVAGLSGRDRADAINSARQTLLAAAGGSAAVIGLGFTARTYYLSRRGQLTDRYTRAIAQLGSDSRLTERLGGIYALEHLMAESPRDHNTVIEVLAAFVRESTRPARSSDRPGDPQKSRRPATDVQAALTVLARRPVRAEPNRIDLSQTDLRGADLAGGRLDEVDLTGAWLDGADLNRASLSAALLENARLTDTTLVDTQLRGANLTRADLQNANLTGADMRDAQLLEAFLLNANLTRSDLRRSGLIRAQLRDSNLIASQLLGATLHETDVRGAALNLSDLTEQQLDEAVHDVNTSLDPHLQAADRELP
jgi:Pentapeptide repeats (8 copies)